ncbi:Fe-S cluster assembly protein SufD [Luteococcus sp.]|uniref:Fe-S cluster assembly protein SufD n=1 Tax=Luteococcus sp. TaxID=1969402 RepID=UPI003736B2A6
MPEADTRPDGSDPTTGDDGREVTTPEAVTPAVAAAIETVASHLHPTPSWDLDDHPEPQGREEVWRFTPMKRVAPLLGVGATSDNLDWKVELPEGATLQQIGKDEARELAVEAPLDRLSALAAANAAYGVRIDVPAETELTSPIVLTGTGQGGTVSEHTVVTIGNFAKATLVMRFEGSANFAEKLDLRVGDGAQVTLVTLQDWADGAVHGGQRSVLVGRDAHVRLITASLGGDLVRLQEDVRYAGPGGQLEQYGLYFVDAGQHVQHRIFVDHNAPRTKSNVDYRGALQGEGAHSVWIGDVLIRKVAEGIETYEANKNLVLTDGCKADSVPNLEIETGEIADAGHSSTTGRFDDNQLFYLMSRGVSERDARRLVVQGFFVEIIRRVGIPEIEQRLMETVEKELAFIDTVQA